MFVQCGAHLFYGVLLPVVELAIAATAFPKQRGGFLAIDLIIARKRKGTLRDMADELQLGTGIAGVPEDVWGMIKAELAASCWVEAEHTLAREFHLESPAHCTCQACGCGHCSDAFTGKGGLGRVLEVVGTALRDMLSTFSLVAVNDLPISDTRDGVDDLAAVMPVAVPQRIELEAIDVQRYPVHSYTALGPSFFALPEDADTRFKRLFKYFSFLSATRRNYGECHIVRASTSHAEHEGEAGTVGSNKSPARPTWGLWSWWFY